MIVPRLSPQGGNSYAIQKECSILPLPVNLSHIILQHVDLLLSSRNSFTNHISEPLYVAVHYDSLLESVFGFHAIVSDHSCVQTYLCVFSSGLWSYFRIRLLNKASCKCKDWIRHRFVQKCLLFWWNFIIFLFCLSIETPVSEGFHEVKSQQLKMVLM